MVGMGLDRSRWEVGICVEDEKVGARVAVADVALRAGAVRYERIQCRQSISVVIVGVVSVGMSLIQSWRTGMGSFVD